MSDHSTQNSNLSFPSASQEIENLLGFKSEAEHDASHDPHVQAAHEAEITDLPVVSDTAHADLKPASHDHDHATQEPSQAKSDSSNVKTAVFTAAKSAFPYLAVFAVGILLYYFFFSRMDLTGALSKLNPGRLKESVQTVESVKDSALDELKKQYNDEYYRWMGAHFFDVSDMSLLEPDKDLSGNGLTNFQKFLFGLNPRSYDTLGLGMADSEALASGINPLSGGSLTDAQKEILEKYIDMEIVMNRLTLLNMRSASVSNGASPLSASLTQSGSVAGTSLRSEADANRVQNDYALNPATQGLFGQLSQIEIDTNVPGRLEVPSLNINVPIMWTQDPKNFDKDLQSGVVHYPGTAMPNQVGTTYISGHSSNYAWAKGNFNQVFSKLGDLADNTSIKITVVQKNGRDARLHYVVTHRKEFKATDQEQFLNAGKPVVALSTCWPVGSTAKRLVVFAELTQVERD